MRPIVRVPVISTETKFVRTEPLVVDYFVHRTKLAKQLPVYTDYRRCGSKFTIIRRIEGEGRSLWDELKQEFPKIKMIFNPLNNRIKMTGDHVLPICEYLRRKGF